MAAEIRAENSTNVRIPIVVEWALRLGSTVTPAYTAERAIDWFMKTSRRRESVAAAAFRASGERIALDVDGKRVVARAWGEGPVVILLHGWNGTATDFRHVVPALVAAGYRAVCVEGEGHGESEGDSSTAVRLARALAAAAAAVGAPHAIVAHSFGGPAAAWALAEGLVTAERLVLVAPVARPAAYVEALATGLPDDFARRLVDTMERRVGVPVDELSLEATGPVIETPTIVLHDTEDRETPLPPVARALRAFPSARLLRTDGLGHRRILGDRRVVDAIVSAVKGTNVRACPHDRLDGVCVACVLEHDLYRREERAA